MLKRGWDTTWASLAAEETDHEGDHGCSCHQSVLEDVLCIGRGSTPEDELGIHELREGIIDLLLRDRGDSADQLMRKRSSERCAVRSLA
jgi:hypothetical protein